MTTNETKTETATPPVAPPPPAALARRVEVEVHKTPEVQHWELLQRQASALCQSTLVPKEYQGIDKMPNCLIALEMAERIGASAFMVMQNLDIIQGRPSFSAKFLIGTVNASGRFAPLRFRFQGKEGTKEWGCRAYSTDLKTKEDCIGSLITLDMAQLEGWSTKSGSKWKTMPEQMLQYRAASFWIRVFAPELSLGMQTSEELLDMAPSLVPVELSPGNAKDLEDALRNAKKEEPTHDVDGVVIERKPDDKEGEYVAPKATPPAPVAAAAAAPAPAKKKSHDPSKGEVDESELPPIKTTREPGED